MKCLDGIQGPVYVGSGCCFNRKALYGFDPALAEDDDAHVNWCCFGNRKERALRRTYSTAPLLDSEDSDEQAGADNARTRRRLRSYHTALERHFGHSPAFIASAFGGQRRGGSSDSTTAAGCSLLREAIHVVSCAYEERTRWGKDVGWMYGSGGGAGVVTGFRMHARGWVSAYCAPAQAAFRSFTRASSSDVLSGASRRAVAAMGVLLRRHSPLWSGAGGRMRLLQRLGYVTCVAYPLVSLPLALYCALPAVCLLTGRSIFPDDLSYYDAVLLILLMSSAAATVALELRWSRVAPRAWWRDQKLWMVTGTSACLAAVFQGVLRACAGVDVGFSTETAAACSSSGDEGAGSDEESSGGERRSVMRWSNLLIPPASLLLANLAGVVVAVSYGVDHGYRSWGPVVVKLALAGWVVAHLQGFLRRLLARRDRAPTIAVLWSVLFVSVLSLLWVNVDSYSAPPARSTTSQPIL
jgi:cellulose synthase A